MAAQLTTLEAVNLLLSAIGFKPVSALDTGGHSEAGQAERFLDYASRTVQLQGFYGNKVLSKEYTAASSKVALATTVLAIKGAGPSQYRNFTIRKVGADVLVYDLDRDVSSFTTGDKIYLDVTSQIPFTDCAPDIQHAILEAAIQTFQRRIKGNPEADKAIGEERLRGEALRNERTSGRSEGDRSNPPPFALRPGPEGSR